MAEHIVIQCRMCRRTYTLGMDALVVTVEGMGMDAVRRAPGVTMFGGRPFFENTRDKSDLVAPLGERTWISLEPETVRQQEAEIGIISVSLARATQRWWMCRECGMVQAYHHESAL